MIKRFTVTHGLAVSMVVHILAFGIIFSLSVFRPASLTGMHKQDMPSFRITLTVPIETVKEIPPEPPDVIAIGGQKPPVSQTDATAVKPPLAEQPKTLNEIIVSTFAKPKPDSIKNTPPVYPYISQKEGQEGVVILLVEVNIDGQVNSVEVVQSSGYTLLDQSALDAVRKWRFNPATENNQPVLSRVKIPVRFKLIENQ